MKAEQALIIRGLLNILLIRISFANIYCKIIFSFLLKYSWFIIFFQFLVYVTVIHTHTHTHTILCAIPQVLVGLLLCM